MNIIAFTGHRPQDLPAGMTEAKFADALSDLGMHKRSHDVRFITGGALGTDTWAAQYARVYGIPYTLILPFEPDTMGGRWRDHDREVLAKHVHDADAVRILSTGPYDRSMNRLYQVRNELMVQGADHVFALWSGKDHGGTTNCIRYALQQGKPVYNLWPLDGKLRPIKGI